MYTLGIDIGSSSVKVALLDLATGECAASVSLPEQEMPIEASEAGWAEQSAQMWWEYVAQGVKQLMQHRSPDSVKAIGITYQMHGLVCLDAQGNVLRKSIIWCDSRAVEYGQRALEELGPERCLEELLNSPGNFTVAKLAWVKAHEPEIFAQISSFMLPGDYILYRLSKECSTTTSGLSEQILWNFREDRRADFVAQYFQIPLALIPKNQESIGVQARLDGEVARELGLEPGTPIAYRAGDQPNNAFSLNVMEPGEVAATGGTSGVVYGVTDVPKADPRSRVNTFLHVNHSAATPRYGVLLCINATGILNAWTRRMIASTLSYDQINQEAASVPPGSDGVMMLPFGNGAERMLGNCYTGASVLGVDLNRHAPAHLLRAAQEGIAFAFRYGLDIMRTTGLEPKTIRAGHANLFLSPLFGQTLATLCNVHIELYNTDGALGAARGAALGAGLYADRKAAFATLRKLSELAPDPSTRPALEAAYGCWKQELETRLNQKQ